MIEATAPLQNATIEYGMVGMDLAVSETAGRPKRGCSPVGRWPDAREALQYFGQSGDLGLVCDATGSAHGVLIGATPMTGAARSLGPK